MIRFGALGFIPPKEEWTGGPDIRKVCLIPTP